MNSMFLYSLPTVSSSRQFVPPASANNGSCTSDAIRKGQQNDKLPDHPSAQGFASASALDWPRCSSTHWRVQLSRSRCVELSWQNRPNEALSQVTGTVRLAGVEPGCRLRCPAIADPGHRQVETAGSSIVTSRGICFTHWTVLSLLSTVRTTRLTRLTGRHCVHVDVTISPPK
jgi:hypothetical protein